MSADLKSFYTDGARRLASRSISGLARTRVTPSMLTAAGVTLCSLAAVLVYFEQHDEWLFFWAGSIRLVYSLHGQMFVNSIMHMGPVAKNGDTAKNLWWIGPFQLTAWGENWHENHHTDANSARA